MTTSGVVIIHAAPGELTIRHPKFLMMLDELYNQLAANIKDVGLYSTLQITWAVTEETRVVHWSVGEPKRIRTGLKKLPYNAADVEQYIMDKMRPHALDLLKGATKQ